MSNEWTGERLLTDRFTDNAIEHLGRYAFAEGYVANKVVLDAACGEGYGSYLLSSSAQEVIGLDIDKLTIERAGLKYKEKNLQFICASVTAIPLPEASVDVIVSYETLEHLTEQAQMLTEFKRVLKQDGLLIISTPDKEAYNIYAHSPFHKKELTATEFQELVKTFFTNVAFLNQKLFYGSVIAPVDNNINSLLEYTGNFQQLEKNNGLNVPVFSIAVCTNQVLPHSNITLYSSSEILNKKAEDVAHIKNTVAFKIGRFITWPFRNIRNFIKK